MASGIGKWLGIGCAGLLVIGCAGSVITGVVVLTTLRGSEAYTSADAWVRASPEVAARVGTPVETGWFPQGSLDPGADQTAEFTHHASGPRGKATVHTVIAHRDGHWVVDRASVDEGGRPVALTVVGAAALTAAGGGDPSTVDVAAELRAAEAAYAASRDEDTIAAADRVIEVDPTNASAHYWRGRAEVRQGDHERALADFDAAVATTPGFADAWEGMAYANARAGHDREAVLALDKLIGLRPTDGRAWADRANARYRLGDRSGARADAERSCHNHYQPGCDLEARLAKMGD